MSLVLSPMPMWSCMSKSVIHLPLWTFCLSVQKKKITNNHSVVILKLCFLCSTPQVA